MQVLYRQKMKFDTYRMSCQETSRCS